MNGNSITTTTASKTTALRSWPEILERSLQKGAALVCVAICLKHPLLPQQMGRLVRQDHQHCADDAFGEPNRGAQPPVAPQNPLEVHKRVEHTTGLGADRRLLEENLLETGCENVPQI